jgi:hypothetical protein
MRGTLFLVPLLAAATTVHTDFEGGSLGRVEKVSDTHFRLGLAGEKDQDGRNRQATWYFFRVDDAPLEQITLDMIDLPGEYNYKPNRGAITAATPPVISYDRKTWTHIQPVEYDAKEPRLRLLVKPKASQFWIAHGPPYTAEHLERLRKDIRGRPGFHEEVIGKTPGGRDMFLWTIHEGSLEGRKTVWLMFRQHSWEAGSSWVGDGAVRALLADNPRCCKASPRSDLESVPDVRPRWRRTRRRSLQRQRLRPEPQLGRPRPQEYAGDHHATECGSRLARCRALHRTVPFLAQHGNRGIPAGAAR